VGFLVEDKGVDFLVEDMAVDLTQQEELTVQMVVDRVIPLVAYGDPLLVVDREILLEMVDIQDKEEDPQKYYYQDKDN